jgi:hypothetical protein
LIEICHGSRGAQIILIFRPRECQPAQINATCVKIGKDRTWKVAKMKTFSAQRFKGAKGQSGKTHTFDLL